MMVGTIKIKNRKIVKQGQSHFIYIPKAYINNELIDVNEKYDVILFIQGEESKKKHTSLNNSTKIESIES